ncbi:GGDEF domain-containing protein [Pelomonas sp. P7]|uniref:diguanylate cyclase n=1 Tax=Pelomonas caseinilytica TaxID=2906763 RepID=A0ABS8XGJ5_9BURK|nr:GGDEF domain-containing protein [Pelomonas sp. P7]
MTAPSPTLTLVAAIGLCAGIATLVWLALATLARIAPRASLTMAGANAAALLSLVLRASRGSMPGTPASWLGDTLAVASAALLGVAVMAITTRRLHWKAAVMVVSLAALALLALPDDGDLRWRVRIISAGGAGLLLAASLTAWRSLSDEAKKDGRSTLAPLVLPLILIALLMAVRGIATFIAPVASLDVHVPTSLNLTLLWSALTAMLLQNTTLAFLVLLRLIRRIERLLERDPLTDTFNRRAFDRALADAHAWLGRGRGYALVMIDMDRFKQLNDSLGHAAGDAALRLMVEQLRPCLREVDRFGRLGGEEFCVLLPDTDLAGAALVAERMRALVEATPLRWQDQDWPLSASFGIAEAERADASADAVLARADAAMYRAKGQGRNVVQA